MYLEIFSFRLTPILREKLNTLAAIERRKPGDMLRLVLSDELERRGLLADTAVTGVNHDQR
jgi:predicted transcriptional regulator